MPEASTRVTSGLSGGGYCTGDARHRATPARRLFTDVFPRISNTFIVNQITGLIDRGHEVEIFAKGVGDFANTHEAVHRYRLEERMSHLPIPHNRLARLLSALGHLSRPVAWDRATLAALDIGRYGHSALNLSQLYTTLSFLRRRQFDVIHVQFGKLAPSLLPLLRSGALDAPLVVAFRGADLSRSLQTDSGIYDELFELAHLFLPVSDFFRRRLESLGAPPERIEVLHSGIDIELFPYAERTIAVNETTRVLFVGRLTEKKGITDVVEALAHAINSGRRAELTVVGEGELLEPARSLAQELRIGGAIDWLGRLPADEVAGQMASSHLLIAPSVTAADGDQEGIPNVVKEAMACGLPVLSTAHSGIPELVEHGRSGYLVPERDVAALSAYLLQLIDHPESWPAMGRAGREKIEREFDIEPLNDRLVQLYRRAQRESGPSAVEREAGLRRASE